MAKEVLTVKEKSPRAQRGMRERCMGHTAARGKPRGLLPAQMRGRLAGCCDTEVLLHIDRRDPMCDRHSPAQFSVGRLGGFPSQKKPPRIPMLLEVVSEQKPVGTFSDAGIFKSVEH